MEADREREHGDEAERVEKDDRRDAADEVEDAPGRDAVDRSARQDPRVGEEGREVAPVVDQIVEQREAEEDPEQGEGARVDGAEPECATERILRALGGERTAWRLPARVFAGPGLDGAAHLRVRKWNHQSAVASGSGASGSAERLPNTRGSGRNPASSSWRSWPFSDV